MSVKAQCCLTSYEERSWSLFLQLQKTVTIEIFIIHRIHKWRTRGKKLVPSHESEALEDKQKLQMKTFSELAECLARISPKITLYGRLFKYSDVVIKRDAYIFMETGSL